MCEIFPESEQAQGFRSGADRCIEWPVRKIHQTLIPGLRVILERKKIIKYKFPFLHFLSPPFCGFPWGTSTGPGGFINCLFIL